MNTLFEHLTQEVKTTYTLEKDLLISQRCRGAVHCHTACERDHRAHAYP